MNFFSKDIHAGIARFHETPGAFLLDVRTPEEFQSGHIPESINIPLDTLEHAALPQGPLFVYCRSGVRSRTAYHILKQRGATVVDIGGILSYKGPLSTT